eukprot:1275619-Prymnesium_polylepis.1
MLWQPLASEKLLAALAAELSAALAEPCATTCARRDPRPWQPGLSSLVSAPASAPSLVSTEVAQIFLEATWRPLCSSGPLNAA